MGIGERLALPALPASSDLMNLTALFVIMRFVGSLLVLLSNTNDSDSNIDIFLASLMRKRPPTEWWPKKNSKKTNAKKDNK